MGNQPINGGFYGKVVEGGGGVGDVTAASNLTDEAIVRGDGGAKGVQTSGVLIDDTDNVSGVGTIGSGAITSTGAIAGTTLAASAASSLTLGTASTAAGGIIMQNATNANTVTMQSGVTSGTYAMTLPLAVGAAGTVLTDAAGDGVLSFAAAGGGAFSDWKSVGSSGADYLDIQASIDALGDGGKVYLLTSITEDSDIALPTGSYTIHLNGFTLTMGEFSFTDVGITNVSVFGWNPQIDEIDFTSTVASEELFDLQSTSSVNLDGWKFDNNSSASNNYLTSACIKIINNLNIECANITGSGILAANALDRLSNLEFTGGGSSSGFGLRMNGGGTANNLTFNGTWSASVFGMDIDSTTPEMSVSNIISNGSMAMGLSGSISNMRSTGGTNNADIQGSNSTFTNLEFSGTVDLDGHDDNHFTNCKFVGAAAMDAAGDQRNAFSNCEFDAALSVTPDDYLFDGCRFGSTITLIGDDHIFNTCKVAGLVTANAGSVRNQFANCQLKGGITVNEQTIITGNTVGALNGGGAATITIAAGTDSLVTGNLTDAAISDSGTTTGLSNNKVY